MTENVQGLVFSGLSPAYTNAGRGARIGICDSGFDENHLGLSHVYDSEFSEFPTPQTHALLLRTDLDNNPIGSLVVMDRFDEVRTEALLKYAAQFKATELFFFQSKNQDQAKNEVTLSQAKLESDGSIITRSFPFTITLATKSIVRGDWEDGFNNANEGVLLNILEK